MIVDEEEDIYDFLEHHGVRGMKWGVRRARSSGSSKTPAQKSSRNKKIAVAAGAAVAVGVGALVARHIISKNHAIKVKNIKGLQSNLEQTKRLMDQQSGVLSRDISKAMKLGKVSPANSELLRKSRERNIAVNTIRKNKEAAQFIVDKHNMSVKSANQTLKSWYDDARVPIHAREYLSGV